MLRTFIALTHNVWKYESSSYTGTLQSLDRAGAPAELPGAGAPVEL